MKAATILLSSLLSTTCFAQSYVSGFGCADPTPGVRGDIGDYQVDEHHSEEPEKRFSLRIILSKQIAGGEQEFGHAYLTFSDKDEAMAFAKADCRKRGGKVRYAGGQIEE